MSGMSLPSGPRPVFKVLSADHIKASPSPSNNSDQGGYASMVMPGQGSAMDVKPMGVSAGSLTSNGAHMRPVVSNGQQYIILQQPHGAQAPTSQPQQIRMSSPGWSYGGPPRMSQPSTSAAQPVQIRAAAPPPADVSMSKCVSFLKTLIKLSGQEKHEAHVSHNVKALVQSLISGTMSPEEFTVGVQRELKSSAQPHLVPFLQRALPPLRAAMRRGEVQIEDIKVPPIPAPPNVHQYAQPAAPQRLVAPPGGQMIIRGASTYFVRPPAPRPAFAAPPPPRPSTSAAAMATPEKFKDEGDDLNDVAAMGGVNLMEESRQLASGPPAETRSLGNNEAAATLRRLLSLPALRQRIADRSSVLGVAPGADVLIGLAVQRRLRDWLERLDVIATHRLDNLRRNPLYSGTTDVRGQLRWVEEVDRLEGARRDERDKELLFKLSKSRGARLDEAEAERLKAKAKELQKAEEEQSRNRDANAAAQLALSGIRKRTWTSGTGDTSSPRPKEEEEPPMAPSLPTSSLATLRTHPTAPAALAGGPKNSRVILKDVQLLLGEMGDARASRALYRLLLLSSAPAAPPPD